MLAAHKHFASHQVSGAAVRAFFEFQCYNSMTDWNFDFSYILTTLNLENSTNLSCIKILIRLARTSKAVAAKIVGHADLLMAIVEQFNRIPQTTDSMYQRAVDRSNNWFGWNDISLFPQLSPFAYLMRPKSFRWNCSGWFVHTMLVRSLIDYEPWDWMRFLKIVFSCKRMVSQSKRLNFKLRPCDARK